MTIREKTWTRATFAVGSIVALYIAVVVTSALNGQAGQAYFLIFVAVSVTVGWILARHVPGNPIGWLLLGIPAAVGGFMLCQQVAGLTHRQHPLVAGVADVLTQVLYFCFLFSAPLVLLFFPDGGLPTPRWRRVLAAYLLLATGEILTTAGWGAHLLTGRLVFDSAGNLAKDAGPGPGVTVLMTIFIVGCLVLALSWVVRRIVGYRHTTGVVRQQFKWLALGAVCLMISLVVSLITPSKQDFTSTVENVVTNIAALPFPLTVGIAVLRYRLYDIDRVISRTVSYALLTGVLIGFYVGMVAFATRVLPFSSPVAVAGSTLAAAAGFNPLRKRLQHGVDRRFNRARYDGDAIAAAFAERLRGTVELDAVREELIAVVRRTLEPSSASLWLPPRR